MGYVGTFVVRIWLEPTPDGRGVWRASATDVRGQERRYFKTPEELAAYLEAHAPKARPAPAEAPRS